MRIAVCALACVILSGCASNPFTGGAEMSALPGEYGNVAGVIADLIKDQGILKDFDGDGRVDVMDPGFAFYVKTEVGGRLVGTNADLEFGVEGTGSRLPAGLRESLIGQLNGPISDEQRSAILEILGWNRQPGNPGGPDGQ